MANSYKIFLSAKWRDLVFLNYAVEPELLRPFVPSETALDSYDRKTYVSLVGFRFCETKLWGKVAVPFHSEFEEANLRFYVRRESDGELRRGVRRHFRDGRRSGDSPPRIRSETGRQPCPRVSFRKSGSRRG